MNPSPGSHPTIIVRFGRVLKRGEHLLARVKEDGRWYDVARLAPAKADRPEDGTFVLQYLVAPRTVGEGERNRKVEESICFYLIELADLSPWAYLCHHTTTTANVYNGESGEARWTLIPATPPQEER